MSAKPTSAFSLRANLGSLVKPPAEHVREIDPLRAIGLLWVCLGHAISHGVAHFLPLTERKVAGGYNPFMALIGGATSAIDGFFCISGFVICSAALSEFDKNGSLSITGFYRRRATRLLPVYFFLMLVCAAAMAAVGVSNSEELGQVKNFVWNVLYVNNYLPLDDQFFGWTWSLAVEEQFYLFFPVLFVVLVKRPKVAAWLIGALLVVSLLLRIPGILHFGQLPYLAKIDPRRDIFQEELYMPTHARFGAIVIGVVAAILKRSRRVKVTRPVLLGTMIATMIVVLAPWRNAGMHWGYWTNFVFLLVWTHVPAVMVATYLLYCTDPVRAEGRSRTIRLLRHRAWHPVARLSYSGYLVNIPVIAALNLWIGHAQVTPKFALAYIGGAVGLTLLSATALYLLVERPVMLLTRARSTPSPARRATGSALAMATTHLAPRE